MRDQTNIHIINPTPKPRNKGKLIDHKPQLQRTHVWTIRTRLKISDKIRDLALFNLFIDSKFRSCDVVRLMVDEAKIEVSQQGNMPAWCHNGSQASAWMP